MKYFTRFVPYLLMMGLLITSCAAPAGPATMDPDFIEPTFTFDRVHGDIYHYDSSLGKVTWREEGGKGLITVKGVDFAEVRGDEAQFSFPGGRTMSARIGRDGSVETVSVASGVVVGTDDHESIVLAVSVARDALSRARRVSLRNALWMLFLLVLGVALFLLTPQVLAFADRFTRSSRSGDRRANILLRAGGLLLAIIPILVLVATGGKFR
ncbi:MAG: hypothetical protein ACOX7W_07000 [Christensenellales bacterium]|jgi:hypothetical protein